MKYFLQTACAAALIGLSGNVYAAVNGINYDPVHNPDWETARSGDNFDKMNEIFDQDLTQIKSMGFNTIKTYYSAFCSDVPRCINPAEKAQNHGLKILLGVFEFPDSKDNTKAQVAAAIAAANDSSTASTVIGIVVGNEDMFDDNFPNTPRFTPNYKMQERILADIATIKGQVSVPVTTAQRSTDWCGGSFGAGCDPDRTDSLNQADPKGVLESLQIIGANIFPYWSKIPAHVMSPDAPFCTAGQSVACETQNTAKNLLNVVKAVTNQDPNPNNMDKPFGKSTVTGLIVTEEGWPSCASDGQPKTNQTDESDYYTTWNQHANQTFDSYYFQTYDLDTSDNATCGGGADKHFGLCTATGGDKIISCPKPTVTGSPTGTGSKPRERR